MSTANGRTRNTLPPDAAIQIRQLLAERAEKIQEHRTKTYVDAPKTITVAPDGQVYVAMESGRVWRGSPDGAHWYVVASPLPDTPARETFDEVQTFTRELKALGHEDED